MATQSLLVDREAFGYMVAENKLDTWEAGGYIYAGKREKDGSWQLYRTYGPKWMYLYQARRVNTQNNAGGGLLQTNIVVASGVTAKLLDAYIAGPVTNTTLTGQKVDEDGAVCATLGTIAAGASRTMGLPSVGTASSATGNIIQTKDWLLTPGTRVAFFSGAAAQTETLTVYIALLLPITASAADITWTTTGSAGTPALAASTISDANTLQAVLLP